jgi:hypothetical protein
MKRFFTLQEARAALQTIRPWVAEILDIRRSILESRPEVWPVIEKSMGNGGSQAASRLVVGFERLEALVERIRELGVLIKDVNTGLLDFPSLRDGRQVYLCWRYGEDDIRYWHDVDAGFAGRQPIQ